jgi:hypothetical protein
VGTVEEQQSYEYINDVVTAYKKEAQGLPGSPKFDVWVQQGTSSHRFDIMDKSKQLLLLLIRTNLFFFFFGYK